MEARTATTTSLIKRRGPAIVRPTGPDRMAYSVKELAAALGTCAGFIRLEIQRGKLRAIKRGHGAGRVLITRDAVTEYLATDA